MAEEVAKLEKKTCTFCKAVGHELKGCATKARLRLRCKGDPELMRLYNSKHKNIRIEAGKNKLKSAISRKVIKK